MAQIDEKKQPVWTTSIKIGKVTAERLAELGKKNETYDDIIMKLLNRCERKKAQKDV